MGTLRHGTCPLCEAMCGLVFEVDEAAGRVTAVQPDPEDPLSRGAICPKAFALPELHEDPDRLRRPVRRAGGALEEISWDAALEEAADRIHAVQEEHGRDAVASYLGNPNVHNTGALLFGPPFVRMLSRTRFSASSLDQIPHQVVSSLMFGHQFLLPVPDLDRARLVVLIGGNPLASGGSLMTAPGARRRLRAVQSRGGRLVVVDPRRTETARLADLHLFVRPGTDATFLAALVTELFARGPAPDRLAPMLAGLDALREACAPWTPDRAAPITGIPAGSIQALAAELLETTPALVHGRLGVSTQAFGAVCQWLIQAINVLTGNLDRPGGLLFTRPAVDIVGAPPPFGLGAGHIGRRTTRVRGLPTVHGEFPAAALAEEIDTPGEGRVRALVTVGGNPVLSAPNGRRLEAALSGLDFQLAVDPYLNETTRSADLVLPPATPLERPHYDLVFHALAVRNTAKYSPPVLPPGPDAKDDGWILLELQRRLARRRGAGAKERFDLWARGRLGIEGTLDLGLRLGPYGMKRGPGGLSLRRLKRSPHGVDLGALEPCLPGRLPRRRIELAPPRLVEDLTRLEETFPPAPAPSDELLLVGRRHVLDCNSWLHNAPRLMKGMDRCTLLVHPADAEARGLRSGDRAVLRSRVGAVTVPVEVSDTMMRGVVSLPHGYGHGRQGTVLQVAARHAGVSINDVTDELRVDAVSGNAAFCGQPVELVAVK